MAYALLATPEETSIRIASALLRAGIRVVDLSGAFRLRAASAYPEWYGFEHAAPDLLEEAAYGLCEWERQAIGRAALVANPGCYPTSALLALLPLRRSDRLLRRVVLERAAANARRLGMDRREFLGSAMGMCTILITIDDLTACATENCGLTKSLTKSVSMPMHDLVARSSSPCNKRFEHTTPRLSSSDPAAAIRQRSDSSDPAKHRFRAICLKSGQNNAIRSGGQRPNLDECCRAPD